MREILSAFEGTLILSQPVHLNGGFCYARDYHAMDKGRQLINMGYRSRTLRHDFPDQATWAFVMQMQRSGGNNALVKDVATYFHVQDAMIAASLCQRIEENMVVLLPTYHPKEVHGLL